jgi:putative transposase
MAYDPNKHNRKSIRLKGYDYAQAGLYFVTICVQHRRCLFGEIQNGQLHLNPAGKMIEKWYAELEKKFPDIQCHEKIIMPNHIHFIVENVGMPARTQIHKNTNTIPPVRADLRVCPNEKPEIDSTDSEIDSTDSELDETHFQLDERKNILTKQNDILHDKNLNLNERNSNLNKNNPLLNEHIPISNEHIPILNEHIPISNEHIPILGEHTGSPLHRVVQWFKTMSTNEYIRRVKSDKWKRFDGKLWQRNYYEHIIRNETAHQNISNYIVNNPKNWNTDKLHS